MACWYPISLNEKRDPTGIIIREKGRNVPCGTCLGCLTNRRNQWTFRIQQELKISEKAKFVTLTYNDEHLPFNGLKKKHLQLYIKRVRSDEKKIRYYAVGEYGSDNYRAHYHAIIFNVADEVLINKWSDDKGEIGFVRLDPANDATIHYLTKYIVNDKNDYFWNSEGAEQLGIQKPFALMSKGLGKNYLNENINKYYKDNLSSTAVSPGGVKTILPRYYREKIFSEDEKKVIGEKNRKIAQEIIGKKDWETVQSNRKAKKIIAKQKSKSNKL